jgi:signal peptidase II
VPNDAADGRPPGRPARSRVLAAIIVGGIVLIDQLTKAWAIDALAGGPRRVLGDAVVFDLRRNSGGAFSILAGFTPLLAVVAAVVAFVLVRIIDRTDEAFLVGSLSLLLGGALGNLIDRLFRSPGFLRGHVIDFIHVEGWPTFNLADSAITVGALCLAVGIVRRDRADHRAETVEGT